MKQLIITCVFFMIGTTNDDIKKNIVYRCDNVNDCIGISISGCINILNKIINNEIKVTEFEIEQQDVERFKNIINDAKKKKYSSSNPKFIKQRVDLYLGIFYDSNIHYLLLVSGYKPAIIDYTAKINYWIENNDDVMWFKNFIKKYS